MLERYAQPLWELASLFQTKSGFLQFFKIARGQQWFRQDIKLEVGGLLDASFTSKFDTLIQILDGFELKASRKRLERFQSERAELAKDQEKFERAWTELQVTIRDELDGVVLLVLNQESERLLYNPKEPLFGEDVHSRFVDARDDIEEAGKCLALKRNKACVVHLMLAMEHALRELAARKNVTIYKGDPANGLFLTWIDLAKNLKAEFIDGLPSGSAEQEEWGAIHSLLWSAGKAWRNPTMHPATSYTDEQAKKVFDAAKGFMQNLAPLV